MINSGFKAVIFLGISLASTGLVAGQLGCLEECNGLETCLTPANFTHFRQCKSVGGACSCAPLMCSFGTCFNPGAGVCDTMSKGLCDNDPCARFDMGYTYPSRFNCRSFYQCNRAGRSVPMCCADDFRYDDIAKECVLDRSCNISCSQREGQDYSRLSQEQLMRTDPYECVLRRVPGKPEKYYNEVAKLEMNCAESTFYNPEKCACDVIAGANNLLRRRGCRPVLDVDFSGTTVENGGTAYINVRNVNITSSGRPGVNIGQFNGVNSFLGLPQLNGVALNKVFIRFRFFSSPSSAGSGDSPVTDQVLFSNCDASVSTPEQDIYNRYSLAIILNQPSSTLSFIAETDAAQKALIRLPFADGAWNNVEMIYDGEALIARVMSITADGTNFEETDTKPLNGNLIASRRDPKIGSCSIDDAFLGYFDLVKIFRCIPVRRNMPIYKQMGRHFLGEVSVKTLQYFMCTICISLLNAQDLPVITFSQNPYYVNQGNDVTILCLVDSPNSPIEEVNWMKNGAPLPTDDRYTVSTGSGKRSSDLVIMNANTVDEGTYTCSAKNGVGFGSLDTLLSVTTNVATGQVDPFGGSQFDVFSGIQGDRVESGTNIVNGENFNVFGDGLGNQLSGMTGSLSSPGISSVDNPPSQVDIGSPSVNQVTTETSSINTVNAQSVSNNSPAVDNSVADVGTLDTITTPIVEGATTNQSPTTETTGTGDTTVTSELNLVKSTPDPVVVAEEIPTNVNSNASPVVVAENKPTKWNVNKPETQEAPAPRRDRIIGGIGGGGFNSNKNKVGSCASECRTNTDACYRPVNCTHYETCFAQRGSLCECTKIRCAFGTFWKPQINNCAAVTTVQCESDPCLKMKPTETYSSGINCRSYYSCTWQNTSLPQCCDKGFAYDETMGRCVPDENCIIPCSVESTNFDKQQATTKAPKYECFFRPVKGKPTKYWNEGANQEQDCAPPLVYRPDICVCGNPLKTSDQAPLAIKPPKKKCDPVVLVDFTGNSIVNKSPSRIWIDPTYTQITRSKKGAQYGRFNGISRIAVPYLSGKSLANLVVRLRFFTTSSSGPDSQVLLSNCETKTVRWNSPEINKDLSPSIAIILNRKMNKLIFLGSTEDRASEQVLMLLPFVKKTWNNVEVFFDGSELSARVRVATPEKQALEFKNSTALTGRLTPAQKAMQIGRCNEQDGFFGFIDMIKIFDCIP
ncbi:uncharacterized protein LOC133188155 [Saccostrea echinata]|uniref:uncharacterized protein LOC133188155 n=1 Tax=Saccostrea echinata TaxID=191078 RepID=UPI002A809960|nr:uncharacterized protein LOC133188155 [Saccostrea echinata]